MRTITAYLKRVAKNNAAIVIAASAALLISGVLALGYYLWGLTTEWLDCNWHPLAPERDRHYLSGDFHLVRYSLAPQWTPDGTHIVFVAEGYEAYPEGVVGPGPEYPSRRIYVVAADGSSLWTISDTGADYVIDDSPSISPDGSRVAYSTYNHVNDKKRYFDIETAALDGSDRQRLTRKAGLDMAPGWLSNSDRIAFRREASSNCAHDFSDSGFYTMKPSGSDVRRVLPKKSVGQDKYHGTWAWSPDEERIAVTEQYGNRLKPSHITVEQTALDVVNADGSDRKRLAEDVAGKVWLSSPEWSPDGAHIAFTRFQDDRVKLLTIGADGSGLSEVADVPENGRSLSWSPDGSQIMYVSTANDLYLVEMDGSEVLNLGSRVYASWSPDGSRIAVAELRIPFVSDPANKAVLYTMASDGSDRQVLVRRNEGGNLVAVKR